MSALRLEGTTLYPNTGYWLEVSCVQADEEPGFLEVFLLLHAPGDDCLTGPMFTNALAIIYVPRPVASMTFRIDGVVSSSCQ
jgi:hypothetical protein